MEHTIKQIETSEEDSDYKSAILSRLRFRAQFLKAVENADSRTLTCKSENWLDLKSMITELKQSASLGIAVPTAFSEKLHRKLASSVPPVSMVHISQEVAFIYLERMCLDASTLVKVLNYSDCHSLLVGQIILNLFLLSAEKTPRHLF